MRANARRIGLGATIVAAIVIVAGAVVDPPPHATAAPPSSPGGVDLRGLADERVRAAREVLKEMDKEALKGFATPDQVELAGVWARNLYEAELAATTDAAARAAAGEAYVNRARATFDAMQKRQGKDATATQVAQAKYRLADAEYRSAEAKGIR
jgi:hypothetical protein